MHDNFEIFKKRGLKILLIMFRRIGDILLTTPVASELKRIISGARIYFLVERQFYDVLSLNPDIDEILFLEKKLIDEFNLLKRLRNERFDLIFDFQSNPRSALLTLLSGAGKTYGYYFKFRLRNKFYDYTLRRDSNPVYAVEHKFNLLRMVGINPENYRTHFYFTEDDRIYAEKVLAELGIKGKRFAIFSTTSRKPAHRWLPEYFVELALKLNKATGIIPAFMYGPGEKEYVCDIYKKCSDYAKLIPEMTLKQAGALLSMADFLLGLDNGLKHLAVAVGTPTFTIFGPSEPQHWTPPEREHAWIRADIDCIGCFKRSCNDLRCMKILTPDIVLNKLLKFLSEDIKIDVAKVEIFKNEVKKGLIQGS